MLDIQAIVKQLDEVARHPSYGKVTVAKSKEFSWPVDTFQFEEMKEVEQGNTVLTVRVNGIDPFLQLSGPTDQLKIDPEAGTIEMGGGVGLYVEHISGGVAQLRTILEAAFPFTE